MSTPPIVSPQEWAVHHDGQLRCRLGVDEWHSHNVFFRDGNRVYRTYFLGAFMRGA
ncbi:MAG: hypothetical protein WAL67_04170 [Candidatus Cybelea sp.]